MKNINTIAQEINAAAVNYRMSDFQEIRRQIHGLLRPKTHKIFTNQTINDNRAFHSGGRQEIQFNIGLEGDQNEWLRYGLAFSLEPSQTLPDPMVLEPKVLKLNEYIRENQFVFLHSFFGASCREEILYSQKKCSFFLIAC